MKEPFNYLTVLASVILAIGLTHLLTGIANIIQYPTFFLESWIYTGWIILLFPLYLTYWWTFWDFKDINDWNFFGFSFILIGPMGLFFATTIYLPENLDISINAHDHFKQLRTGSYAVWVILQLWGILLSPLLKDKLDIKSFLNRYKLAQGILLIGFLIGFFSNYNVVIDVLILLLFWVVLIYIIISHRSQIKQEPN